jgi:dihydroflavonol-4-reductase
MVVVTGATGHLGNVLVRELLSRNVPVRAVIPAGEDTTSLDGLKIEKVEGNVLDIDSLVRAFQGLRSSTTWPASCSLLPDGPGCSTK